MVDNYSALATQFSFIVTFFFILSFASKRAGIQKIVLSSYVLHLVVGTFLWNSNVNIGDARGFVTYGQIYAWYLKGGPVKPILVSGKEGWPKLLGNIFYYVGSVPEIGIYINAFLLSCAAIFVHLACKNLNIVTEKPIAALVVSFAPASIYWGSLPGREPSCWFCISVMVYSASRLIYKFELMPIILMAAATITMFPIRGSIALGLLGTFVASIGLVGTAGNFGVVERRVLAFLVVLAASPAAMQRANDQGLHGGSTADMKTALGHANSSFVADGESGGNIFSISTLKTIPNIALGPLPWEWRPSLFLAIFDALFWAFLWYGCYTGVKITRRFDVMKLQLAPALIMIITMSATLSNYGIVMRMRGLMIPVLAPVFALWFVKNDVGKVEDQDSKNDSMESNEITKV